MKHIKVESCGGCPYLEHGVICSNTKREDNYVYDIPTIPSWCPLENAINLTDLWNKVCSVIPFVVDEDIPDNKEEAYEKGYGDAIVDCADVVRTFKPAPPKEVSK